MSNLTDEDDEFLYGDTEADNVKDSNMNLDIRNEVDDLYDLYEEEDTKENEQKEEEQPKPPSEPESKQDSPQQQEQQQQEDEDEESDDDLEIILEAEEEAQPEPSAEPASGEQAASGETKDTPVNIKPGQQGKPSSTPTANAAANNTMTKSQGGINLEAIGEYNGEPITDVDLDNVEDKPWRKPGADITDYFNYGFNEITWRSYCAKQKMLRENKKMMGDIDMNDFMSMSMMMPPNMMEATMSGMPGMPGMPNPMMGLPMGMPPPPPSSGTANSGRGRGNAPSNFNQRNPANGRNMIHRPKADGKEGDMMEGAMDEGSGMFPMEFPGGPGSLPMNMFPPDMTGGPMGMPFFNPAMPPPPPPPGAMFDNDFNPRNNRSMRGVVIETERETETAVAILQVDVIEIETETVEETETEMIPLVQTRK
ncbi:Pre-mRNA polyadenylation factor fip1 [Choanephora cucurbitarum]|uniref:Pre-mRNA polyadenylation factor fip1 n=1 Tax=Choanephora cucurbitarum TaxID=101091 RepID=A0A1C7NGR5_9FUNG|nr:Pre-mRNA polyadenylation factor fip1 [Choanephora cucurbitarum]